MSSLSKRSTRVVGTFKKEAGNGPSLIKVQLPRTCQDVKVLLGVADVVERVAGVDAGIPVSRDARDGEDVLPADVADPDSVRRVGLVRESSPVPVPEHGRSGFERKIKFSLEPHFNRK